MKLVVKGEIKMIDNEEGMDLVLWREELKIVSTGCIVYDVLNMGAPSFDRTGISPG